MDMEFKTYTDKWHPDIADFRDSVCRESGAADSREFLTHRQTMEKYDGNEHAEEIYKFSQEKWNKTEFDSIEAMLYRGKIVSISGCRSHDHSLRILMHRHTLHDFRQSTNRHVWQAGGFIERHLNDAVARGKSALFFTIYEHNITLKTLAAYFRKMKRNAHKPLLHKFQELNTDMLFNGVPQSIFYYLIDEQYCFTEKDLMHARN